MGKNRAKEKSGPSLPNIELHGPGHDNMVHTTPCRETLYPRKYRSFAGGKHLLATHVFQSLSAIQIYFLLNVSPRALNC